jgi:hypothetical protein
MEWIHFTQFFIAALQHAQPASSGFDKHQRFGIKGYVGDPPYA